MSDIDNIIELLKNKKVTIGIHGEKGEQKKIVQIHAYGKKLKKGQKRETISPNLTVAQVATINEFGGGNTPSRPFLRKVLREKQREIYQTASTALKKEPLKVFDAIGQYVLNQIQLNIKNKVFKPNADSTIAFKGSSTPLVNTGQLRNALTYKVSDI